MKIGINSEYQIKQINNITDTSLIIIDLVELILSEDGQFIKNPDFPFDGWSEEEILKYCYKEEDGEISIYPHVLTQGIEVVYDPQQSFEPTPPETTEDTEIINEESN